MIALAGLLERAMKAGACEDAVLEIGGCADLREVLEHKHAEDWVYWLSEKELLPDELISFWRTHEEAVHAARQTFANIENAAWLTVDHSILAVKADPNKWRIYSAELNRAEKGFAEARAAAWTAFAAEVTGIMGKWE